MPLVALAPVFIALALLLIYLAGQQLHLPAFSAIAHNIPAVGGLLLRAFLAAIDWAIAAAESAVNDAAQSLIGLIATPVRWFEKFIDLTINSFYRVGIALERIITVSIPGMGAQVLSITGREIANVQGWAQGQFAAVYAWASGQFAAVYHFVDTEIALAEGYTQQLVAAAEQYAEAGIQADARYAEQLYTTAIGYTDSQIHAVEGWVTGEIGQVTTWAGAEISALSTAVASDFAKALSYAEALVIPVEAELTRLERECTDNLCSNLGGLANLLNALGGDLGLAALIALAGEMAHDPKGTAAAVDRIFSGTVRDAASIMRAAAGV